MADIKNKTKETFTFKTIKFYYFCMCIVFVFCLAGIRTAPLYGKLDFLLLDNKPWWPEWRPLIEEVLGQGEQPVFTDPITSAVFKGVFNQKSVLFKRFTHSPFVYVEGVSECNKPDIKMIPVGALVLLDDESAERDNSVEGLMAEIVTNHQKPLLLGGSNMLVRRDYPFRCVINVHGFTPTWVAEETGHWRSDLAETLYFYRYNGTRGSRLVSRLHEKPPENCYVFF